MKYSTNLSRLPKESKEKNHETSVQQLLQNNGPLIQNWAVKDSVCQQSLLSFRTVENFNFHVNAH